MVSHVKNNIFFMSKAQSKEVSFSLPPFYLIWYPAPFGPETCHVEGSPLLADHKRLFLQSLLVTISHFFKDTATPRKLERLREGSLMIKRQEEFGLWEVLTFRDLGVFLLT